jgi:hypothetical protein
MSSNGEHGTVLRGVTHGACDFLIKPVRIEELRNIWQHVVRRQRAVVSGRTRAGRASGGRARMRVALAVRGAHRGGPPRVHACACARRRSSRQCGRAACARRSWLPRLSACARTLVPPRAPQSQVHDSADRDDQGDAAGGEGETASRKRKDKEARDGSCSAGEVCRCAVPSLHSLPQRPLPGGVQRSCGASLPTPPPPRALRPCPRSATRRAAAPRSPASCGAWRCTSSLWRPSTSWASTVSPRGAVACPPAWLARLPACPPAPWQAPHPQLPSPSPHAAPRRAPPPARAPRRGGAQEDPGADERGGPDAGKRGQPPPKVPAVPEARAGGREGWGAGRGQSGGAGVAPSPAAGSSAGRATLLLRRRWGGGVRV